MEIIADILFPRRCPVCHEIVLPKGSLICPSWYETLSFINPPTCKKCGKEVLSDAVEYCFDCSKHQRSFKYGYALINYNEAARDSMVKIKYKNRREYLDFYTQEIIKRYAIPIKRMNANILVPVPVHPGRQRKRGFNQAEILAKGIGKALEIPVDSSLLRRDKKTVPQKELTSKERLKNLEQAFSATPVSPNIHSVILVDDIYTTGSTVEACARALKRAGVKRVYFLTICIGQGM